MRAAFHVAVALAYVFSGCATRGGMWYEYNIKPPSQTNITRARGLLRDVAAAAEIPFHYPGSDSRGYTGDDVDFEAVVEDGELRILLHRSHSPPTAAFKRTKHLLDEAVAKTFGVLAKPVTPDPVIVN